MIEFNEKNGILCEMNIYIISFLIKIKSMIRIYFLPNIYRQLILVPLTFNFLRRF